MPIADILIHIVSYCSIKRDSHIIHPRKEFFFFHPLSIKQSLPPASLHIRSTMNNRTKTRTVTSLFFLFLFAYLCSKCFWPSVFQMASGFISSHPTTPSNTNKSVSLGAKNWEPVCPTGDNTVHAPAINQLPSNQR